MDTAALHILRGLSRTSFCSMGGSGVSDHVTRGRVSHMEWGGLRQLCVSQQASLQRGALLISPSCPTQIHSHPHVARVVMGLEREYEIILNEL